MEFKCPHCDAELRWDTTPGDSVNCPNCGKEFVIPDNETVPTSQEPTMTQMSSTEKQNPHQIPALLRKGRCKHCGLSVLVGQNPCPHCGHELKWSQAVVQNRKDRRKTGISERQTSTGNPQSKRTTQPIIKPSLTNSTTLNSPQKNETIMKNYLKTATLFALIGIGARTAEVIYSFSSFIIGFFRHVDGVEWGGWVLYSLLSSFINCFSCISVFMFFLVLFLIQQKRTKGD